jgi:1-acyl-sn-glycerol-3-phosphate acyltransferase
MAADPNLAHCPAAAPAERRDLSFYWRLVATAVSFTLFGLGGLVVGMVLLPLVRIFPASRERKRARARRIMQGSLWLFVIVMHRSGVLTYEFVGIERLGRPGQLVIANHPSLVDVVFLLAFTPGAGCVVKQGLWRNPITRAAVTLAEYISNDSTATMIEATCRALQEGQTVIMFPEGTRTRPRQPFVFHRSAANIGLRAAAVVTPVYIRCVPTTLTKAEPWYRIPERRFHMSLIVGQDLDLSPFRAMGALPQSSRELNDYLQEHFYAQLDRLNELDRRPR